MNTMSIFEDAPSLRQYNSTYTCGEPSSSSCSKDITYFNNMEKIAYGNKNIELYELSYPNTIL